MDDIVLRKELEQVISHHNPTDEFILEEEIVRVKELIKSEQRFNTGGKELNKLNLILKHLEQKQSVYTIQKQEYIEAKHKLEVNKLIQNYSNLFRPQDYSKRFAMAAGDHGYLIVYAEEEEGLEAVFNYIQNKNINFHVDVIVIKGYISKTEWDRFVLVDNFNNFENSNGKIFNINKEED